MFWKHRNWIAYILLLAASVLWVQGRQLLHQNEDKVSTSTVVYTQPSALSTVHPTTEVRSTVEEFFTDAYIDPDNGTDPQKHSPFGITLCCLAVLLAMTGIFILRQRSPLLGPDGVAALVTLGTWALSYGLLHGAELSGRVQKLLLCTGALLCARELWGWWLAKCRLNWCLLQRFCTRCKTAPGALVLLFGWIFAAFIGLAALWGSGSVHVLTKLSAILVFLLALTCLWSYGADLQHFQLQLENYRKGLPILVKNGAFAQTEQQLLTVQADHEEAVRRAVSGERFKVELIANVSHDLRTPLTSILGYSELLQQQSLSPEGEEQLKRLHQKAGYMNELVESLFELTKVSSGVVEPKKEEIDLIRLLEQTVGLFDDRLEQAGLTVRRHYACSSALAVTDGARMHQVFANLLGNAIKYALTGTRIHLELRQEERDWLIRMVNTASYEMDFQEEEILQRFVRGDKARSTKGSGLGLAIAQTYTQSVGGSFRVLVDGDQFSALVRLPRS